MSLQRAFAEDPVRHRGPGSSANTGWASGYVRSGGGYVAYELYGTGPRDVLVVNEQIVPIEALHDNVFTASFLERLGASARVILFDRRGVGLSDPIAPGTETKITDWVDDALAVLNAVGSERAAVFSAGPSAGCIALQLAAVHPERVAFLGLYDASARFRWAPDYPWGVTDDEAVAMADRVHTDWGTPRFSDRRGRFAATAERHPGFVDWAVTWMRRGAGPATHRSNGHAMRSSDMREMLPHIVCPTLIINHVGVGDGPYLADHIPDTEYVELTDPCHVMFSSEFDDTLTVINEFFDGSPIQPSDDRVLTTLLFTDIVGSTTRVAEIGDRRWAFELDVHFEMVRRHIVRFGGTEIKTVGDGFVATFDAPTRAVQCALAVQHEARSCNVDVRAGVHTGEVERRDGDVFGVTVHVTQRICSLGTGGRVLVSSSVFDLVRGSDLCFEDLGEHRLKGLEGTWNVFAAATATRTLHRHRTETVSHDVADRLGSLSPRECEVLTSMSAGRTNAEIATALFISEATVKAHLSHLFTKTGCANRVQLALFAHRSGLATL